jgi:hypothetical protein
VSIRTNASSSTSKMAFWKTGSFDARGTAILVVRRHCRLVPPKGPRFAFSFDARTASFSLSPAIALQPCPVPIVTGEICDVRFTSIPAVDRATGKCELEQAFPQRGRQNKAARVANVDGARWDNLGTMRPQEALSHLKGGLPKNRWSVLRIVNGPSF